MHTDAPVTLRLELMTAALIGSARPESFNLYQHKGSFVTEDNPFRTPEHEPQAFLGLIREVIANTGELVRQIDRSRRWRPGNIHLRDRELAK